MFLFQQYDNMRSGSDTWNVGTGSSSSSNDGFVVGNKTTVANSFDNSINVGNRNDDVGVVVPIHRCRCFIHKEGNCSTVTTADKTQFHIVPVRETTKYAQTNFNDLEAQRRYVDTNTNATEEFWECLTDSSNPTIYTTPIAYCSAIKKKEVFERIMDLCRDLDSKSLVFPINHDVRQMLTQHIITDGCRHITLCNKHLLNRNASSRPKYSKNDWTKKMLLYLFPSISRNKMPTNTPDWAIHLFNQLLTTSKTTKRSKQTLKRLQ